MIILLTLDGIRIAESSIGTSWLANETVKSWTLLWCTTSFIWVTLGTFLNEKFLSLCVCHFSYLFNFSEIEIVKTWTPGRAKSMRPISLFYLFLEWQSLACTFQLGSTKRFLRSEGSFNLSKVVFYILSRKQCTAWPEYDETWSKRNSYERFHHILVRVYDLNYTNWKFQSRSHLFSIRYSTLLNKVSFDRHDLMKIKF